MLASVHAFAATGNTLLHTADLSGMSIAKSQLALQSPSDASAWQAGVAAVLASVSCTRDCRLSVEGKEG